MTIHKENIWSGTPVGNEEYATIIGTTAFAKRLPEKYYSAQAESPPKPLNPISAIKKLLGTNNPFETIKRLYIGCVDSRSNDMNIFETKEGQALSHRNVGATVMHNDLALSATLELATEYYGVENIIYFPHALCGGVNAHVSEGAPPIIESWMAGSSDVPVGDHSDYALREIEREHSREGFKTSMLHPTVLKHRKMDTLFSTLAFNDIKNSNIDLNIRRGIFGPLAEALSNNFAQYRKKAYDPQQGEMPDLIAHDQHPKALIISDINSASGKFLKLKDGDALSQRHPAALIPTFNPKWDTGELKPEGVAAAIEFAVAIKGVSTLVLKMHDKSIIGEYLKSATGPDTNKMLEAYTPELKDMKEQKISVEEAQLKCLNIGCENLMTYPAVKKAIKEGTLSIVALFERAKEQKLYIPGNTTFREIEPPSL